MYLDFTHPIFRFSFIVVLVAGVALSTAHSATVTVDPLAATVPGSVYADLPSCVEVNMLTGDQWADGNNDTVLLSTNTFHRVINDNVDFAVFGAPNGSVTVRSAGPGPAIIVSDPFASRDVRGLLECATSGNFTFENLTLIGKPNQDGAPIGSGGFELRGAFKIAADAAGERVSVNIRNVVVTANNGSNGPILDYTLPFPTDNHGTFMRAIHANDDRFRGDFVDINVENCVFAYTIGSSNDNDGGGVAVFRARDSGVTSATQEAHFKNCLFTNCQTSGVSIGGGTENYNVTLEDCLISNVNESGISLSLFDSDGIVWGQPTLNVLHTIIDSPQSGITNDVASDQVFTGTLNLDEVTFNCAGQDAVSFVNHTASEGNFNFSNVIAPQVSSLFRLQPDPSPNSGPAPLSLSAASLATNSAALASQAPSVQSTLSAAVVSAADPGFFNTAFGPSFVGLREWDSTTNDLFDVTNVDYAGIGTVGADLGGGAEFIGGNIPTPPSSVDDWRLYE